MQDIINEIKQLIAANIDLGGMDLSKFGPEDAIFGETGLGLDSLDAVELIMLLQKNTALPSKICRKGGKFSRI